MSRLPADTGPHRAVAFDLAPDRAGQARRILAAHLRYWRLPQLADRAGEALALLLADIRRPAGPGARCRVQVLLLRDRLALVVCDHTPGVCGAAAPIAAARDSGGVRAHEDAAGRTLWLTLPLPGMPDQPGERARRLPWSAHA
ncbi:hypothetical protein [Streptomyces sp. RFCAC02]|uniref:hypothetical protein n=1 Tax=Streptomyces sp. RFCAC02 TaxID=2499143 RepID=UPI0010218B7C|nr:hypothetical protein [Streptomyces sp. RFCAC02]